MHVCIPSRVWHVHGMCALRHIHSGFSCDHAAGVQGQAGTAHYYEHGADPWSAVKYMPDGYGVAHIDEGMPGFSLHEVDMQPLEHASHACMHVCISHV